MAEPNLRGITTGTSTTSTVTVQTATGTQAGDTLFVARALNYLDISALTAPSGSGTGSWSLVRRVKVGNALVGVYRGMVTTGGVRTLSLTQPGGSSSFGLCATYVGEHVVDGTPTDGGSSSATASLPSVNLTDPDAELFAAWSMITFSGQHSGQMLEIPASMTRSQAPHYSDNAQELTIGRENPGAGSSGSRSATARTSSGGANSSHSGFAGVMFGISRVQAVFEQTGSDAGEGSESGSVAVEVSGGDTGSGSESGFIAVPRYGSDFGEGAESGYVDPVIGEGVDTGHGSEGTAQISADTTGGDTGTGSEGTAEIAADTTGGDTGTGDDGYGHIMLPGGDEGEGSAELDRLDADTVGGDSGLGSSGGYVETRYGDLVISIYGVDPDDGHLVPLPDFVSLSMSPQRNAAGSITLDYPTAGINFDWLYDRTVGADADLEVEIWNYGNVTGALRGYLQEASGYDVGDGRIVWTFAGRFLELRMSEARVEPQPLTGEVTLGENVTARRSTMTQAQWDRLLGLGYTANGDDDPGISVPQKVLDAVKSNAVSIPVLADPKRELKFAAASPGAIVETLLTQARARGALTDITTDADDNHDSAGNAWPELITTTYSPSTTYVQILDKLVTDGRIEWALVWTGYKRVLKLWVAGKRGVDRTVGLRPVVLRAGRNIVSSPRKWSIKDSVTTMFAAGSEGWYASAEDLDARTRRGRVVEGSTSSNSLTSADAVTAYAQHQLSVAKDGTLEIDHSLGFLPGEPRPLIAFDVGDWVYSQTGTELDRYRVVQWSLTVDAERNQTGIVVLNDAHTDAVVRQRQQLDALASGDTVVGTSTSPRDTGVPLAPEGLVVGSAAFSEGQDIYAVVSAGWEPVTTNTDGTNATDVDGYQVEWTRYSNPDAWVAVGSTPTTQIQFTTAVALPILVRVLCYDRSGNRSEWTELTYPHTTDDDVTPPGVPSTPTGANYLGTVAWTWDGLTVDGADMYAAHPDFAHAQLHMSTTSDFTPDETTRIDTVFGAGTYTYVATADGAPLVYGTTYFAKLVAVDLRDNASEPSGQASAVTGKLVNIDLGPDAVDRANIVQAAIGSAEIDTLAVNDGHIQSLGVGKLTAGLLEASMIMGSGAIIAGNESSYHVRVDSAGIRLFGANGSTVVSQLLTSNGSAAITGEFRTSLTSGRRIVLNPGGGSPAESRWYPADTNQYARIMPSTSLAIGYIGQGGINMKAHSSRGDQQSGEVNVYPGLASLVWGNEEAGGYITSRIAASDVLAYIGGPRARISARTGQYYGIQLALTNSSGNIVGHSSLIINDEGPNGLVRLISDSPNGNSGIQFNDVASENHGVAVISGGGAWADLSCRTLKQFSDRGGKTDIEVDPIDAVAAVRGAHLYRYRHDGTLSVETERSVLGLMTDELPPEVVSGVPGQQSVDPYGVTAVLWGAMHQVLGRLDRLEGMG